MNELVQDLVRDACKLISLPEVFMRVNKMVDDPSCSTAAIGEVITQDPGLTARLLKVANSPLYGFSSEIDTVPRAVTVLGTRQIRDLALATSASRSFDGIPNDLISMDDFWHHSIYCALAARSLASKCDKSLAESTFVGGLLHDIGRLVIFNRLPDKSREVLKQLNSDYAGVETFLVERQLFGFDHAQVGAALAQQWKLPLNLQECIEFHHQPGRAKHSPVAASVVHIANTIACMEGPSTRGADEVPSIDPFAWEATGLDEDSIAPTIEDSNRQYEETKNLFNPTN